jgi:hypothetical protein
LRSLQRMWLGRRMRLLGTLNQGECANLLQLWAKMPAVLWGEPERLSKEHRYYLSDDVGIFCYSVSLRPSADRVVCGSLRTPGGRVVFVTMWREALDHETVKKIRVVVDARTDGDERPFHVAISWSSQEPGLIAVTVSDNRFRQRERLYRLVMRQYGWCARSATTTEFALMYLTHLLPQIVADRSRSIEIGPA